MTDREALAAALGAIEGARTFNLTDGRKGQTIVAAARAHLAQLPEKCQHGKTNAHELIGEFGYKEGECSGRVYPAELVERAAFEIALVAHDEIESTEDWETDTEELRQFYRHQAVAVLDALNGETP